MLKMNEVLKASKLGGGAPDYWTELFARRVAGGWKVTELTGTLPITFRANGSALVNYRVYGTAAGAGERTKNLFQITENGGTVDGVTYTTDIDAGTAIFLGTCTSASAICPIGYVTFSEDTYVYLSGGADGGSNDKWYLYAYDMTAGARPKKWDGVRTSDSVYDSQTSQEILCPAGHNIRIAGLVRHNVTVNNIVFKPMLRAADTTPDFIPYGYQIPLTITNGTENKTSDIFIGDTKLSSGDYVDYETQTITRGGISEPAPFPLPEISTYKGTNTLDSSVEVGKVTIKGKIKEV